MKLAEVRPVLEQAGLKITEAESENYPVVYAAELWLSEEEENRSGVVWHGAGHTEEEAVEGLLYWMGAALRSYVTGRTQGFQTLPSV